MRRILALFTAALLLLCQTSALAQLCLVAPAGEGRVAAAAPCHDIGANDKSPQPGGWSVCEASHALTETEKAPVFAFPALPVLVIAPQAAARPAQSSVYATVHAVCSSPPFTVLHCRFLN